MKTFNATPWTDEEIEKFPKILIINNNWRQRTVHLHEHPTNHDSVISHGVWYDGTTQNYCIEKREDFARELSSGLKHVTVD